MALVYIEDEKQKEMIEFDLPFSLNELTYSNFIDVQKATERMETAMANEREKSLSKAEAVEKFEEGLKEMFEQALEEGFDVDEDYIVDIVAHGIKGKENFQDVKDKLLKVVPFNLPNDTVEDLFEQGFVLMFGSDISIVRLYVHINNMIDRFDYPVIDENGKAPLSWTFDWWKDEKKKEKVPYILFARKTQSIITGEKRTFKTGEAIEIKEWQRLTSNIVQSKGDIEGNFAFKLGLAEFSILARQEGEELPSKTSDRRKFIKKRSRLFEDIPVSEVLKVRFFLQAIIVNWLKGKNLEHSLKEKNLISPEQPKKLKLKGRHTAKQKPKQKELGILQGGKGFIRQLLKKDGLKGKD